jgi:hypothetical protein
MRKHRTSHPVQHVDLTVDAVGESELKHPVANDANLRNVRSQAIHHNGSIAFSVSPARARFQFSRSSAVWSSAQASTSRSCAQSEPVERPDPPDEHAMTWRIPGPGGHVRHYVALAAIDDLVASTDATSGTAPADPTRLKRCWLYGFFLRDCEEAQTDPPLTG